LVAPPPSVAGNADLFDGFARELRHVDSYDELIGLVQRQVLSRLGLTNAWLYVLEREDDTSLQLVATSGSQAALIRELLPMCPRQGDPMIELLLRDTGPVIVPDAQVGPFPDVVRRLGNRTVVNQLLGVVDHALGVLGCGTFGEEGVVAISPADVQYLMQLANLVSVALARLVLFQRAAERAALEAALLMTSTTCSPSSA
jgi:GAF domain-containing protein